MENCNALIEILLDDNISLAERDDAAIDLSNFDEDSALNALIEVAKNNKEDEVLLASCGESIAKILLRHNIKLNRILQQLTEPARKEAESLIEATAFCISIQYSQRIIFSV